MTADASKIIVTEDFRDKDGGPTFVTTPDFPHTMMPTVAEFIFKANEVLAAFRKKWIEEHTDSWSKGVEMDVIPVMSDGMIFGYMVVSELTGDEYDFAPAKTVETEEKQTV